MSVFFRQSLAARAGAVLMIAALGVAPAMAQDDAAVATLNGEPITEADIALAERDLDPQFEQLPEEQRRAAALAAVIDVRLFANEAERQELDQTEDFQRRMAFLRERALHSAFIDRNVVADITDEEVRARYDEEIAQIEMPEEVRARHILVETEEEATAIIEELDAGTDFAALAEEHSQDGSAAQGGDLGYFSQGRMVPAFEEAAFALEPGNYTQEPVESQFGWHVILVEDRRTQEPPALEQVENQIRSILIRERYVDTLAALRDDAELEIPEEGLRSAVDMLMRRQAGQTDAGAPQQ